MFAYDLCHSRIEYYSNAIDLKGMIHLLCMSFILQLCFSVFCHTVRHSDVANSRKLLVLYL
jgi:hypothetical protein